MRPSDPSPKVGSTRDRPIKTHKQLMQDCIAKHKAQDSNASLDDLKKVCRAEIKSYDNHPSAASPSQTPPT